MHNPTHAVISLEALSANLRSARQLAGPDRAVMAAVKANAYGHGAVQVSCHIEENRLADALGVATVDEGVELRSAGIRLPIVKLSHAFADELDAALNHDITLSVVDEMTIAQAEAAAAARRRTVAVHLKIDTGMRRIGAEPGSAVQLAKAALAAPHLLLEGIFTHLPISDVPAGADFTAHQLRAFRELVGEITATVGGVQFIHASNSGGLLGHDLSGMTMVRPGIMLYGYAPDPATRVPVPLEPVMSIRSRVSFLKEVPAGETVGYGRTWSSPEPTWIATVPVGYGDGYSRLNSNRGRMLVNGASYPVAGRVCMDQTMLNLGTTATDVAVGDEVVVLGTSGSQQIGADELAAVMGTIPYEVTCLITPRVQRLYR